MHKPEVTGFFDAVTNTISYVVASPEEQKCAVIDSLLDYDAAAGRTCTTSADKIIHFIQNKKYTVEWIIDTHVHADHLTAAPYIKENLGGQTGIGKQITTVQKIFREIFNTGPSFDADGRQFDHLFSDEETYMIGSLQGRALHTPGHTPACISHLIGDALFVGDTLFMPDVGSARCDFPGGDAGILYDSIQKLFLLEDTTRVFLCHDYLPANRDHVAWETTIAAQKKSNIHVHSGVSREEFIKIRTNRDNTLSMPKLIVPSVQVNMRAGDMPQPEDNGVRYMKVPINIL